MDDKIAAKLTDYIVMNVLREAKVEKKCLHCKHDVEYDGKYLPSDRGEPFCELHHVFITDAEEFMYCDDFDEEPSYWLNPPIMEFDGEIFWTWDAMPRKKGDDTVGSTWNYGNK